MSFILRNRVRSTTTTTGTGTFTLGAAATGYQAFSVIGDGNKTFYCITNNKDWEVGIGTYTSTGTTLSRDIILESSNSNQKVDWVAGTKDIFIPYPAGAAPGSTETEGTTLYGDTQAAWHNIRKYLVRSYSSGVLFSNPITLTESVTRGSDNLGYAGGVLTPNGDIHFCPVNGNRGRKINIYSQTISTYNLVYTVSTEAKYVGGVLAPNGDVHFIPFSAPVGQKVSPSGIVSTYSLVYTTSSAYTRGVLAPNGDIHFVPRSAAVGQKISSSGVVSTYPLAYTGPSAYAGGVLAPNGEVHFVPNQAPIGQKIDINGNAVLYGLAPGYTNFGNGVTPIDAYECGVLDLNGDIHFVPHQASFGMKVSSSTGLVSTYSIINTGYIGGAMAPDGTIHFCPAVSSVGQRISVDGIASTYSVAQSGYYGYTLAPDGALYAFPNVGATTGTVLKIITLPGINLPMEVCLSSFFNKS